MDSGSDSPVEGGADVGMMARAKSAHPDMQRQGPGSAAGNGATNGATNGAANGISTTSPIAIPAPEPAANGLSLLSWGRVGSLGSEGLRNRARSLMDLPSFLSSSVGFSTFSAAPSQLGTPERVASPPPPTRTPPKLDPRTPESVEKTSETQLSLDYLTLPLLRKAVATYMPTPEDPSLGSTPPHANSDPSFLVNSIRTVFSSSDSLNRSFQHDAIDPNGLSLGLDIPSIRQSYALILSLEPRQLFHRTLANALEILLASLQLNIARYQNGSPKLLRQFLILLEPQLGVPARFKDFIRYDSDSVRNLAALFHGYISDHFYTTAKPDESLICAVKVLSMLYHANEFSPLPCPISIFYNETLNRKLNFKEEYKVWKKTLEAKTITDFSFFNYPFLFDPVAKTRILHIDAMVQMSQEFEDAVVHQAIVIHAQRFLQDSPSVTSLEQELKGATNPFLVLEVRRQHLVKDVLDQIRRCEKDMKKPLKV
ncbi:hypothetical protein HK101_005786, partial [Irineochytrium annulatum]